MGDDVWLVKGKKVQIWSGANYALSTELPEILSQVSNIEVIGNEVWLPGSVARDGHIWIFNKQTGALTHTLKRPGSSTVYKVRLLSH